MSHKILKADEVPEPSQILGTSRDFPSPSPKLLGQTVGAHQVF